MPPYRSPREGQIRRGPRPRRDAGDDCARVTVLMMTMKSASQRERGRNRGGEGAGGVKGLLHRIRSRFFGHSALSVAASSLPLLCRCMHGLFTWKWKHTIRHADVILGSGQSAVHSLRAHPLKRERRRVVSDCPFHSGSYVLPPSLSLLPPIPFPHPLSPFPLRLPSVPFFSYAFSLSFQWRIACGKMIRHRSQQANRSFVRSIPCLHVKVWERQGAPKRSAVLVRLGGQFNTLVIDKLVMVTYANDEMGERKLRMCLCLCNCVCHKKQGKQSGVNYDS